MASPHKEQASAEASRRGGAGPRRKGGAFEREVVALLQQLGIRGAGAMTAHSINQGWRRLRQELAAAPTHDAATVIFHSHDFLFLALSCDERERRYAEVEDIIRERNSHRLVRVACRRHPANTLKRTLK
jgi:hypothetical protein